MKNLTLAVLVVAALAAGGAAFAGEARAQSRPPDTYYGAGIAAGDVVTASIGGALCGRAVVGASGIWSITVAAGGCGGAARDGATVTFAVNGVPAEQTAKWRAGGTPDDPAAGITLTVASPNPSASFDEVRISAWRLDSGLVEFALQPRIAGVWDERILPSSRYFNASAAGGWLNSSPVDAGGAEVRISARLLADGRIEFALQPREGGVWGERVLPFRRYFPADAPAGRWLNSSAALGGASMTDERAECSLADHLDRVRAATFQVENAAGARGTAFYIGGGEWLTNHHVVDSSTRVRLYADRDDGSPLLADVAGSLPGYDLALLRAQPPASVRPLRIAASNPPVPAGVAAVGFPTGARSPAVSRGVVSRYAPFSQFYRDEDEREEGNIYLTGSGFVLQTDALTRHGNSGGPMVDDCGVVVGVVSFGSVDDGEIGLGAGIAAETVIAQLAALRSAPHAPEAPARLTVTAFCTADAESIEDLTEEECRDGSLQLDRSLDYWQRWLEGVTTWDWDEVLYRFNGGAGFDESEMWERLDALPSGCHEIAAFEDGVSTHWSEPYRFCIAE